MPIKSRIDIGVDSDKFKQSFNLFQKYQSALKEQYGAYVNHAPHIKAAAEVGGQVAKFLDLDQAARSQTNFAAAAQKASLTFKGLASGVKQTLEGFARVALSPLEILFPAGLAVGLFGLGAGLVGAGSIYGLERGAAGVSDRRREAMGLGVSYGSLSSFDLNFSRFGVGPETLGAVASGIYDFTSPEYIGLRSAGATARTTDEAAIALIRAIPRLFNGIPEGQIDNRSKSLGLGSILDLQTIVRLKNHPEEIEAQVNRYQLDRKILDISKESQEKWASFNVALERAGLDIETVLGKNLVSLADPLNKVSEGFVNIIDAFIDSGTITESLKGVESGLGRFTDYIGGDEFKQNAKGFVDAITALDPYGSKIGLLLKGLSFGDEVLNGLLAAAQGNGAALRTWLAKKFGADFLKDGISGIPGMHTGSDEPSPGLTGTGKPSIRYGSGRGQSHAPSAIIDSSTLGRGAGWNASVGAIPPALLARVQAENPNLSPRQCVELVQSMMHVGNVHDWRRGPSEKDSPEGAALATFGVHGESQFYALGGSGTPGIGRDHAVKLVKKYPDGSFDAISQDSGHAPHLIHMPWTGQGGEGDASSYYGIFNSSGPAGDNASLFNQRASAGSAAEHRGTHILDHMEHAPPGQVVVHDMTGGASQVTISRHQAAL